MRTNFVQVAKKQEASNEANSGSRQSVALLSAPIYMGGKHRGASMGPQALKVAGLVERITELGYDISRQVDIPIPESVCWWDKNSSAKCVPEIGQVAQSLAEEVDASLAEGAIAISLGGDHSLAVGSIAGAARYYRQQKKSFGLIWFDAHGDINTPETSPSGNVHGMGLAVSLGRGDKRLVNLLGFTPKLDPSKTVLVGIRDLDPGERKIIAEVGIKAFTMSDIDRHGMESVMERALQIAGKDVAGLHVSLDIDVLDPEVAPGVSTPAIGGVNFREMRVALEQLFISKLVKSIDVVELNPALDDRSKSAHVTVELLEHCLGKTLL